MASIGNFFDRLGEKGSAYANRYTIGGSQNAPEDLRTSLPVGGKYAAVVLRRKDNMYVIGPNDSAGNFHEAIYLAASRSWGVEAKEDVFGSTKMKLKLSPFSPEGSAQEDANRRLILGLMNTIEAEGYELLACVDAHRYDYRAVLLLRKSEGTQPTDSGKEAIADGFLLYPYDKDRLRLQGRGASEEIAQLVHDTCSLWWPKHLHPKITHMKHAFEVKLGSNPMSSVWSPHGEDAVFAPFMFLNVIRALELNGHRYVATFPSTCNHLDLSNMCFQPAREAISGDSSVYAAVHSQRLNALRLIIAENTPGAAEEALRDVLRQVAADHLSAGAYALPTKESVIPTKDAGVYAFEVELGDQARARGIWNPKDQHTVASRVMVCNLISRMLGLGFHCIGAPDKTPRFHDTSFLVFRCTAFQAAEAADAADALPPTPEITFVQHDGCIPQGDDLASDVMTVEEAKRKARDLPGCKGFCFPGVDEGKPVQIFFKSRWKVVEVAQPWKAFKLEAPRQAGLAPVVLCLSGHENDLLRFQASVPLQDVKNEREAVEKVLKDELFSGAIVQSAAIASDRGFEWRIANDPWNSNFRGDAIIPAMIFMHAANALEQLGWEVYRAADVSKDIDRATGSSADCKVDVPSIFFVRAGTRAALEWGSMSSAPISSAPPVKVTPAADVGRTVLASSLGLATKPDESALDVSFLDTGVHVEIYGVANEELEGKLGRCWKWDPNVARWQVRLDDTGELKAIKPMNLRKSLVGPANPFDDKDESWVPERDESSVALNQGLAPPSPSVSPSQRPPPPPPEATEKGGYPAPDEASV